MKLFGDLATHVNKYFSIKTFVERKKMEETKGKKTSQ